MGDRIFHCRSFGRMFRVLALTALLGLLVNPIRPAGADMAAWRTGQSWVLEAVYRNNDGSWSEPRIWHFSVADQQEHYAEVTADPAAGDGAKARLYFDRQLGYLAQVRLDDRFRDEKMQRFVRMDQPSPVYPLLSVVPFYFPYFGPNTAQVSFQLKRVLNDRPIGGEALEQRMLPIEWPGMVKAIGAASAERLVPKSSDAPGIQVRVTKHQAVVFEQYWFPGYPWAIYTESDKCKVWLKQ